MREFEGIVGPNCANARVTSGSTGTCRVERTGIRGLCLAAGLLAVLSVAGCTVVDDAIKSPEQKAAEQPQRVSTEGAKDEFPNLGSVPGEPKPYSAPEYREQLITELSADREKATFTGSDALVTAAPVASSTVISSGSVTTSSQVADVSRPPASQGQLAAIIFFGHGSIDLDSGDRRVLRDLVTLQSQQGGVLRVVGHASSRTRNTTPEKHQVANFEMSLERAKAVSAELLRLGVEPDLVSTEAKADAEPVYHEFMPSGEAGNRRVEIFLEN